MIFLQNPVVAESKDKTGELSLKGILKTGKNGGETRKVSFRAVLADYVEPVPVNVIDGE